MVKYSQKGGDNMDKVKQIAKYTTNILSIIAALVAGINAVDGITIPYAIQIVQIIAVLQGVIGTYLLSNKIVKDDNKKEGAINNAKRY
jgi:amino acid permease